MEIAMMVVTILVAMLGSTGLWALLQKWMDRKSATAQLLRGLAHESIVTKGMVYIERGWITKDEYDDFMTYLWLPYSRTGGNGLAEKVMRGVDELPIKKAPPGPHSGPIKFDDKE